VEAAELDTLLDELETKVERLRSLYEQYFLGIEKMPPNVAQKDVDRRIYSLRREQIRNTAKRFKLQTIIQRYNTFQQYWMRILREIENGTYRRHVLRAERTVGVASLLTAAERKRLGLPEREPEGVISPAGIDEVELPEEDLVPLDTESALQEPGRLEDAISSAPEPRTPLPEASQQARAQLERDLNRLLDDELDDLDTGALRMSGKELDDPLSSSMPPPARKRQPTAKPVARRSTRPTTSSIHHVKLPHEIAQHQGAAVAAAERPEPADDPAPDAGPPSNAAPLRRSTRANRPEANPAGQAMRGGLRLPATSAVGGRGLPPLPKTCTPRGAPAKVPGKPIIPVGEAPPPSQTHPSAPNPSAVPRRPSADPQPANAAFPAATLDPPPSIAIQQPQKAQPRQASPPESGGPASVRRADHAVTFDRTTVEQVAEKLRHARGQTHESSEVSVDALAKKLQATAEELRKRHVGKRIDFDVVIKNGKAIIKPIVR
jgi:hypothetical protein